MRIVLITLLAVAAMAASVLYASGVQRRTAEYHGSEAALSQGVLADVSSADADVSAFIVTGDPQHLDDRTKTEEKLTVKLLALRQAMADDAHEAALVGDMAHTVAALDAIVSADAAKPTIVARQAALRADFSKRQALVDQVTASDVALQALQAANGQREDARAARTGPLLILALSLAFATVASLIARRARRMATGAAQDRALQERFGEAMQVADSQAEAHGLLKTHLERLLTATSITVLNRNNSADRLEPSTPIGDDSLLGERLQQARPRSCMAVRLSRPFKGGACSEEVLSCEVCSQLGSKTTCQPLLVGGEVIGAVLAEHSAELTQADLNRIGLSVSQAAPVLANLRNLALAETRAATDALTGLPNRRALDETLLRMLAQAGRNFDPLSAILLDLDHFKLINDTYGHDRGDEVLAAFAARLREVLRSSDFAGRSGGEEFVLFLPATDRTGAVRLAEKIRAGMRELTVAGVERPVTASFGIACFPDDAVDAPSLMRCADRALYAAKRAGRDRIEASSTGAPFATAEPREGADASTLSQPDTAATD